MHKLSTKLVAAGGLALVGYLLWKRYGQGKGIEPGFLDFNKLLHLGGGGGTYGQPWGRVPILNWHQDDEDGVRLDESHAVMQAKPAEWLFGGGDVLIAEANLLQVSPPGHDAFVDIEVLSGDLRACCRCCQLAAVRLVNNGASVGLKLAWPNLSPPDLGPLSVPGLSVSLAEYPAEGLQSSLAIMGATCRVCAPGGDVHSVKDGVSQGVIARHTLNHARVDWSPDDVALKGVRLVAS